MNMWNGYSDVCSINVFRKTHLDGVSYHIGTTTTIAFEILQVLIAFGGDGEEPFWFSTTHQLYRSEQQNFQKMKLY